MIKITTIAATMLLGTVCAFASNFADTYGFSPQGIALGNAMTARVNDWSSVYYNMAGLGRTAHLKSVAQTADDSLSLKKKDGSAEPSEQHAYVNDLAVCYFRTVPMLKIDIPKRFETDNSGNPVRDKSGNIIYYPTIGDEIDSYGFTIMGLAVDLNYIYKMPSFISSARIGMGMGANDDLSAAKLNDIDVRTHNFLRYGREAQKAVIMAGAGFGFLNDLVGFGGGLNISFSGEGSVLLEGVNMDSKEQIPNGQSKMDLSISPSILAGMYVSPGQLFPVLKGLDFGASYRQESYMEIYPFKTSAMAMDNAVVMEMVVAIMDYYSPHILTCGVAYSIFGATVSFDAEYHMWSKYKLNASNNALYSNLPKFKDIFVFRVGGEYQLLSWVSLMGGFYYQPSFIPESAEKGVFNFLDNDKSVTSLGAKFGLPRMFGFGGPVEITVAYQFQYLMQNTVQKEQPTSTMNPSYRYSGTNHSGLVGLVLKL